MPFKNRYDKLFLFVVVNLGQESAGHGESCSAALGQAAGLSVYWEAKAVGGQVH